MDFDVTWLLDRSELYTPISILRIDLSSCRVVRVKGRNLGGGPPSPGSRITGDSLDENGSWGD